MKRVTLIRTAPEFPPGSMPAYANLVERALFENEVFDVRTCSFFDSKKSRSMRQDHLWRLRHARRLFDENPSDLYHLLDGSMAGLLPSKVWKKTVVTVHDLIPLLQLKGRLSGRPGVAGRWLIRRSVKVLGKVAGVAVVSNHTRHDVAEVTGRSGITVIPNPVRPLDAGRVPPRLELPDRYLLHVGNNADYKNRSGVLDVFSKLQKTMNVHLVMAGPPPTDSLRRRAAELGRVHFLVNVTDSELSLLYKKAAVFLFPSIYEGFGMPVLEAMAAGCPVVCSSAASLPEVAGQAALIAAPDDIDSLARHCAFILSDPEQSAVMSRCGIKHAAEFTLERFAATLNAWYLQNLKPAGDLR